MIGETPVPKPASVAAGGKFVSPQLFAVNVVAEQAAGAEVRDDVLAVGRAGGSGGAAVGFVVTIRSFSAGALTSQASLPSARLKATRVKFVVVECGEDELVADDDGRRQAARDGDLPLHVFIGAEFDGRLLIFGDAGAVGAAELRPGERFGCQHGRSESDMRKFRIVCDSFMARVFQ